MRRDRCTARRAWSAYAFVIAISLSWAACSHSQGIEGLESRWPLYGDIAPRGEPEIAALTDSLFKRSVSLARVRTANSENARPLPELRLQAAFAPAPETMFRVHWVHDLETGVLEGEGVILNAERLTELAWAVDSTLAADSSSLSRLSSRRAGDYALLLVITHELAHVAYGAAVPSGMTPNALKECVIDIVGGLHAALVAEQMSEDIGLRWDEIIRSVAALLTPGHWIAEDTHPDGDQRAACLSRGVSLMSRLRELAPIADTFAPTSPPDSSIIQLARGNAGLIDTALGLAGQIVSVRAPVSAEVKAQGGDPSTALVATIRNVFRRLAVEQSQDSLGNVIGSPISRGITLFPDGGLNELTIEVDPPWRCAVTGAAPADLAFMCYVLYDNATILSVNMLFAVERTTTALNLSSSRLRAPTGDASTPLRFWLVRGQGFASLVSVVVLPYRLGFPGRHPSIVWFSYTPLPSANIGLGEQQ